MNQLFATVANTQDDQLIKDKGLTVLRFWTATDLAQFFWDCGREGIMEAMFDRESSHVAATAQQVKERKRRQGSYHCL